MEKVSVLGIDLAKNVFQIHAADKKGKKIFSRKVKRDALLSEISKFEKGKDFFVAMEACGGSHHVARTLMAEGFQVKLIAAQFVKPFVKSNKNDAQDAQAIVEAAQRPTMRFVGVKSQEQQYIQTIHRVREQHVEGRTAKANAIRGFLLEYGITVPQGIHQLRKAIPKILAKEDNGLLVEIKDLLQRLFGDLLKEFENVEFYDKKLKEIHDSREDCQRLGKIDGVGVIVATALVAAVGDPKVFKNGRQFAAWMGLIPRQISTGGKTKLLGITKRGDKYLRKNLIHGCRAVVIHSQKKTDKRSVWIKNKLESKGYNKTAVATANKTARAIWVVLAKGEEYKRAA